jgi:hypothetical protein
MLVVDAKIAEARLDVVIVAELYRAAIASWEPSMFCGWE